MAYIDTPFPPRIAFGAQRIPGWATTVVTTRSGREFRNQDRQRARHRYDLSFAVRTRDDYAVILDHFHMMRGRAHTFPFFDHLDHAATLESGFVTSDGGSPEVLRLVKRYGVGAAAYDRLITRPDVTKPLAFYAVDSAGAVDVSTDVTLDDETGIVTLAAPLDTGQVLQWAGEFFVPCRYDTDELPGLITNRQPGPDGQLFVECSQIIIVEDLNEAIG